MLLYRLPTICRGLTLYMTVTIICEASKKPGIELQAGFLFSWIRLHLSMLQALAQGVREMQSRLSQLF